MLLNVTRLALGILFLIPTLSPAHRSAELTVEQSTSTLPPSESLDCLDLQIMERLARIAGPEDVAKTVAVQRMVTCLLGGKIGDWPNGRTIKVSQTTWDYPTGKRAKVSDSTWDYPSGRRAKVSATTWDYPDGRRARHSESTWSRPDGSNASRTELLTWACFRLASTCEARLTAIKAATGDQSTLAIIEMAWLARLEGN
jgi:hypothetical protein